MATPIGTNVVTALSRRFIMPFIVDNIYGSIPFFFRMNQMNRRMVQGGTQIEVPLMYKRFATGGPYQGYDLLDVTPSDTVKNGAWDWKQQYVNVTVDGLTLIKTDSPDAVANFLRSYFAQAEMEFAENLAVGLMSDTVTNAKEVDGLKGAVDAGGVATTYAGLLRSGNTFMNSQVDTSTATFTLPAFQAHFSNVGSGGRHATLICSRVEQYNRFHNLNQVVQNFPMGPGGADEQLASAGFTNLLYNNVPWLEDSHVFDGPNTSNSAILTLNEDYFHFCVTPRADFYLEDFQKPVNQDAMVSKILWAGNLVVTNTQRQGKMTNISA